MFTRMHGYANYLLTEIPKHEKLFQERKCYSDLMETIGEIHLQSLAGIGFLNLLSVRIDESEEESFLDCFAHFYICADNLWFRIGFFFTLSLLHKIK